MDREKIKKLLDKINRLYQTMEGADPMERDLMLYYIRQLYEEFYFSTEAGQKPVAPPIPPVSKPIAEPRVIEIPDQPEPRPVDNTPRPTAPEPKPVNRPKPRVDGKAYAALFEIQQTKELAQKLRSSPIQNLQQAFTINDRLLFTNELFAKDAQAFQEALRLLNRYEQFEEAKSYLQDMASQYNWMEEQRLEIAKDFVHTVKRRFPG